MNEKRILTYDELNSLGRAQEISRENDDKLLKSIIADIKKVMRKNNLVSLSAPGIGYNKRVFCIDFSGSEIKTFINPVTLNKSEIKLVRENCSSIPGKEFIVPRHEEVDIIYETPSGVIKTNNFKEVAAYVIQHELDHLEGVTLEDIGLEIESDFLEASEEDQQEIISLYLDSLKNRQEVLNNEIKADKELTVIYDRLKFSEALAKGEVTFEHLDELVKN